jgi:hypothetical protein
LSMLQLRLAAGDLNFAQLADINRWLLAEAPTSPAVPTPQNISATVPADAARTPH